MIITKYQKTDITGLSSRDAIYVLREEYGMSFRQIAEKLNLSQQRVHQLYYDRQKKENKAKRFRPSFWQKCVYEGLADWAVKNKIALNKFAVLLGYGRSTNSIANTRNRVMGKIDLKKSEIDRILLMTRGKYEDIFRIREVPEIRDKRNKR